MKSYSQKFSGTFSTTFRHQSAITSSTLLRQLHCLKVPWRIDYKLAVLIYTYLHGLAPSYLADELHHPAESEFRRRLRSASSYELRTVCSSYPTLILQRPSFSTRRCTDLFHSISHLLRHFLSSDLA